MISFIRILSGRAVAAAASLVVFCGALLAAPHAAHAVPAFARQTGMECASCHVGSFGPQLTETGRAFKLGGYTMGEVKNKLKNLSAMVQTGFEHTHEDLRKGIELTPPQDIFNTNNNFTVEQVSLFYGGTIVPHLGMLAQATYDGTMDSFAWDNTDIRYANNTTLGGKGLAWGLTFNNNPTVQDLWQTTPAWGFPFVSSGLAPAPAAGSFISSLGGTVGGAGAYGMWDDMLYLELTGYHTLGDDIQQTLGEQGVDTTDHLRGIAPYWRAALQHDFGPHYVSIGTYGMSANRFPGDVETNGTDNMLDTAIDATWQFTSANGLHNVSLYGSALHEREDLSATFAMGNSSNSRDTLNVYQVTGSYYFKNTYGVTLQRFETNGSNDPLLYAGQTVTRPNNAGWTVQADWTPFGHQSSPGYPYLNTRLFVQYTAYDKFNGSSSNYDGTGRGASANNLWFTGIWFAF